MTVPCCGPKCSAFCAFISLWGMIMLSLLGAFFYVRSPSLAEDLPIDEHLWKAKGHNYNYIEDLYRKAAISCWIASGLYVATFILSCILLKINLRQANSS